VYDELERIWKEAVMACFKVLSHTCLEGLRKAMKPLGGTASLQVKIDGYRIISWYTQSFLCYVNLPDEWFMAKLDVND
jgi:hypothetical protein